VIARVTRVRRQRGSSVVYPEGPSRRSTVTLPPDLGVALDPASIAPVSPAFGPRSLTERPTGPVTIPLLPGERTVARRVKFAIANGCTIASLLLGMSAAFLAIGGELRLAAIALLACVVFDGCDGGLARRFGVASPFGAQMDSLADLSSFGVATGIVVYQWLTLNGAPPIAAGAACALIVICAAIRLARFNVSPKDGRYFSGVPTTMTAAVLALDILLGPVLPPLVQVAAVATYAIAMVTAFPYAKLSRVLRLPLWLGVVPAICAMISVSGTFAVIVTGYLVSGPLLWALHRRRPVAAA
jgi:CDP-diacylglycerol--serine O-phosphatidyltransferase